jgi:hypothetical protein
MDQTCLRLLNNRPTKNHQKSKILNGVLDRRKSIEFVMDLKAPSMIILQLAIQATAEFWKEINQRVPLEEGRRAVANPLQQLGDDVFLYSRLSVRNLIQSTSSQSRI